MFQGFQKWIKLIWQCWCLDFILKISSAIYRRVGTFLGGAVTFFVGVGDPFHFLVGPGAEDFDQRFFVGAAAFHGLVQLFGAVFDCGHHQTDDDRFEMAAQFTFQVLDEILINGNQSNQRIKGREKSWKSKLNYIER